MRACAFEKNQLLLGHPVLELNDNKNIWGRCITLWLSVYDILLSFATFAIFCCVIFVYFASNGNIFLRDVWENMIRFDREIFSFWFFFIVCFIQNYSLDNLSALTFESFTKWNHWNQWSTELILCWDRVAHRNNILHK